MWRSAPHDKGSFHAGGCSAPSKTHGFNRARLATRIDIQAIARTFERTGRRQKSYIHWERLHRNGEIFTTGCRWSRSRPHNHRKPMDDVGGRQLVASAVRSRSSSLRLLTARRSRHTAINDVNSVIDDVNFIAQVGDYCIFPLSLAARVRMPPDLMDDEPHSSPFVMAMGADLGERHCSRIHPSGHYSWR